MEEKVLIQSTHYNIKRFGIIVSVLSILLSIILLTGFYNDNYEHARSEYYDEEELPYCYHTRESYVTLYGQQVEITAAKNREEFEEIHPDVISYAECSQDNLVSLLTGFELFLGTIPLYGLIFAVAFYFCVSKQKLTLTDKRVYGKAIFGKRIDLPLDSISSVGVSWLKGIDVGTSSGRIRFTLIKNNNEIHSFLSNLLIERQKKERQNIRVGNIVPQSDADELKKFKDLLDAGVITQEEFDAKKKQLLGL